MNFFIALSHGNRFATVLAKSYKAARSDRWRLSPRKTFLLLRSPRSERKAIQRPSGDHCGWLS